PLPICSLPDEVRELRRREVAPFSQSDDDCAVRKPERSLHLRRRLHGHRHGSEYTWIEPEVVAAQERPVEHPINLCFGADDRVTLVVAHHDREAREAKVAVDHRHPETGFRARTVRSWPAS